MKNGNFFPPEFKEFPFKKGDILASKNGSGAYTLDKIIAVDKVSVPHGTEISIQGQAFVSDEDDWYITKEELQGY